MMLMMSTIDRIYPGLEELLDSEEYEEIIEMKDVIFTHHKHLLNGSESIMFDDSPVYLESFKGVKVAMDYPFNRHIETNARVKDWYGFEKYLQTIGAL